MHDPMAMRPFMGYNFGAYLQHWLDLEKPGRHMPKVFHVNWFRLDDNGKGGVRSCYYSRNDATAIQNVAHMDTL